MSDPVGDGAPMRRGCPGRLDLHDLHQADLEDGTQITVTVEVRCLQCGDLIGIGAYDGQVLWVQNPEEGTFWGTEHPGALTPLAAGGV